MKKSGNNQVLLLTQKGNKYGMGHYTRMLLLKEYLKTKQIEASIITDDPVSPEQAGQFKVVILDSRDDSFPDYIVKKQITARTLIAVDNRGPGRQQADVTWDTLPHFEMTPAELVTSLERCIINPELFTERKENSNLQIIKTNLDEIQRDQDNIDVIQLPGEKRQSGPDFLKSLHSAQSIAVYYGQTFFEALFLGKTIYLYSISEYHEKLSEWFVSNVTKNPDIIKHLDGKGLYRLYEIITSRL